MGLPFYLAMTAREWEEAPSAARPLAYMDCHFSPYGTGLTGIPEQLPPGSLLVVDDRIPLWCHDPALIVRQLQEAAETLSLAGVLLDLQDPAHPLARQIAHGVRDLPCPVAAPGDCRGGGAVFLPPVPPDCPPARYLAPWQGREIWLDMAPDALQITVDTAGSRSAPLSGPLPEGTVHRNTALCCSYVTQVTADFARFTLFRTRQDMETLLKAAEPFGVTCALGLYQQLQEE